MYFLMLLIIAVCVLLGSFVLIQNPNGNLQSKFSTSMQLLGIQKTGNVLEKGTWVLALSLMLLSLVITVIK